MKNTFTIRNEGGVPGDTVGYTPLIYTAGSCTHRLALHTHEDVWVVSHPVVGARIAFVRGTFDVHARADFHGVRDARQLAIRTLDALLERIGSDKFNAVIDAQLERVQ